jgi:CheY-like chemotaxis protein
VEDRSLQRTEGDLEIGLTPAEQNGEVHRGPVKVDDPRVGAGSEPKAKVSPASGTLRAQAAQPDDESTGARDRKRRILVVDDNRDAVESLGMLLEMMAYDVRTAEDGLEAVDVAAAFRPDVILLDIGLPRLNGYETAQRIRQLDGGRDTLLVALTGWGQEEDRRRSREAGFDHHLVKPVDPDALEQLLQQHTAGRRSDEA